MDQSMKTQPTRHHRRGRPRVSDVDRRSIKVSINLSQSEAEQLSLKSEDVGMECASYIRVAALGNTITAVPAVNRDAYLNLGKLAGNLNQLMRAINTGNAGIVNGEQVLPALQKLRAEVQALRASLVGA